MIKNNNMKLKIHTDSDEHKILIKMFKVFFLTPQLWA